MVRRVIAPFVICAAHVAVRSTHDAAELDRWRRERAQLPDHAALRGVALLQNVLLAERSLRRLRPQSVYHDR